MNTKIRKSINNTPLYKENQGKYTYFEILNEKYSPIYYDISEMITEEYGISNNVRYYTDVIYNKIKEQLSTSVAFYSDNDWVVHGGQLKIKVFNNNTINIKYWIYEFESFKDFKKGEKHHSWRCTMRNANNTMEISHYIIGDKLGKGLKGKIQHELSHYLSYKMSDGNVISDKELKLYNNVKILLNNKQLSKQEKDFNYAMYYSFPDEQIAFSNTLDEFMRNNPDSSPEESELFSIIYLLRYIVKNFKRYEGIGTKLYGKTDKFCYKRLNKAYLDYCRRFGRVLVNYIK